MLNQKNNRLLTAAVLVVILPLVIACAPQETATSNQPAPPRQDEELADANSPSDQTADSKVVEKQPERPNTDSVDEREPETKSITIPESWVRLGKDEEIWIDTKAKEVIIAGTVCLNQGALEMFICPEGTKEHESVISANALASQVHAALIALGADPGKSTSWDPEYRAAYGPTIDIKLIWHDSATNKDKSMPASQWIRNVKTKKPMEHKWVFGGSEFWQDPDTGEQVYYGDSGEMVCLSNFSTATIDVNVESSESNAGLLFEALTENIPPVGTKVYAVIQPGKRIEPEAAQKSGSEPQATTKTTRPE